MNFTVIFNILSFVFIFAWQQLSLKGTMSIRLLSKQIKYIPEYENSMSTEFGGRSCLNFQIHHSHFLFTVLVPNHIMPMHL